MGFMRVAVVTDIHGNRRAFHAVLEDLRQVAPDLVVHGGDLVFGGTHPREIIDEIRTLGWPGVLGNTDEMLWTQERPIEMASAHPHLASLAWTAARHGCADASTNRRRTVALAEIASDSASGRRICRSACKSEGPMAGPYGQRRR